MFRDREVFETKIIPHIGKGPYVLTGGSALVYSGLSASYFFMPNILHNHPDTPTVRLPQLISYRYDPDLDIVHYCEPLPFAPMVYKVTAERALIENIKFKLADVDEGEFLDSFVRYLRSDNKDDFKTLKEVAELFKVPWDEVEYWIAEAYDYQSDW